MEVFRRLIPFFWRDRKLLYISLAFLVISTAFGLVRPLLLKYLIDDVIQKKQFELIPNLAFAVLLVFTFKAVFQFAHGLAGGRLGNRLAFNLRNALYDKLQGLSYSYYDKARTGDLMSRLTADLEGIRFFFGFGMAMILNTILMVLFGMVFMAYIHWPLMLITMITMPLMGYLAIRFESRIHPAFRNIRQSLSQLTTAVQENITGVRTVKSFAREGFEVDKFSNNNTDYRNNHISTAEIWARYFPLMELTANLSLVILLVAGGYFVFNETMLIGELVAFFSYIWFILGPLWGLGFMINMYTQSKASGERVLEVLDHSREVKDAEDAVKLPISSAAGHVHFDQVSFSYSEQNEALHQFQLDAPAGSVIGILGSTGSGKSTVVQLLMRAYEPQQGQIRLDGRNINDLSLESLREQIAIVFQETFLFSSSIRNNIAYGRRDVSQADIERAAKLAQAHEFIMELPLGYDTVVGERGLGLSGGQKQRMAIARALLRDPRILVLDDATSAVDMETEHAIQQGLKEVMVGRTTFIIAHRISSLRHADEIIVLDQGRIVQRGKHEELLKYEGPYVHTYNIQYADRPKQILHERRNA
jgi:ATP-binding cassette subfamily B multidrug efflux pump